MANDRHEEALKIMTKYHGEGDRQSPIVQLEFREMQEEISMTGADKRWWDFRELFNSREVRYRTMLTVAIAIFGQWLGNGAVSYYYPQMLAGAGIENNHLQLLLVSHLIGVSSHNSPGIARNAIGSFLRGRTTRRCLYG